MIDRVALDNDEFTIEPRPIIPIPESIPTPITSPEPPKPQPDPATAIAQATVMTYTFLRSLPSDADAEEPGQTESAVLLRAIVIVARRAQTFVTQCALRDLVRKFAHQYSLDF
jgi:hypothetical protein